MMEYLYSPWRSEYFDGKKEHCVFCEMAANKEDDEKNHLFYRDDDCYMVMNKYPYTPGHFLIIPNVHKATPGELDDALWIKLALLMKQGSEILLRFGAGGVNSGINILKSAGAGIPEHLHIHMVPRFTQDTNFMTAISDARVYGVDFEQVFQKIKSISEEVLKA